MPTRSAKANWVGTLRAGNGRIALNGFDQPYSFQSRFEQGQGTNPEELIGAAIAGCFSMALSGDLEAAGHAPADIRTTAKVSVEPKPAGGFAITQIALETEANVPGIDDAAFQRVAAGTKENCPVSQALKAVPISLEAKLT